MSPKDSLRRINALAIPAAVLFAAGAATVLVLDRIGAPDRLVRTIAPILTLIGLALVGLGARSADIASFLAAKRSALPFYGGLGLAATATGMALCLYPGHASPADPPLLGMALGVALGAIVFAPLIRRCGATSGADLVATRFSRSPAAIVAGIAAWATAAATTLAGFETAVNLTQAFVSTNRLVAEILVAAAIVLSVTPGGLAGVIACSAASAVGFAIILGLGFASSWIEPTGLVGPTHPSLPTLLDLGPTTPLAPLVASALAVAGFFALQSPALGSRDAASAVRAGIAGTTIWVALTGLGFSAVSAVPAAAGSVATGASASLAAALTLAAALALAGAGAHASSRAFGVKLGIVRRPFPTPASVRLARMRSAQVALVVGCAICDSRGLIDPRVALVLGMTLSLAVTTPTIALAAIERVGPAAASVGSLAALAVGVMRAAAYPRPPGAAEAFENALVVAVAAFVAGALTSFIAPRRAPSSRPGAFDPFAGDLESGEEQAARFVVDPPVAGRENAPAFGGVIAVPGRDHAARALNDGRKRDDVVRF